MLRSIWFIIPALQCELNVFFLPHSSTIPSDTETILLHHDGILSCLDYIQIFQFEYHILNELGFAKVDSDQGVSKYVKSIPLVFSSTNEEIVNRIVESQLMNCHPIFYYFCPIFDLFTRMSLSREILLLLDEAEMLRKQLITLVQEGRSTAVPSVDISCISESEMSLNMAGNSPASTIYLKNPVSKTPITQCISPELTKLLPTIPSVTHRRALLANERPGARIKWKNGFTALHWAAQAGRNDVYDYLVARGADPNAKDRFGVSAKDLLKQNIKIPSNLSPEIEKAVRAIQQVGWDNVKWGGGWTVLHWACQHRRTDVIEFCKRFGASMNVLDDKGFTPEHYFNHERHN